jgi:peptide alpha-N-acetyltransferase
LLRILSRISLESGTNIRCVFRFPSSNPTKAFKDATDVSATQALSVLQEFCTQIPRATAPKRLALTIASGDPFRELVTPYLLSGLKKGVPSLFSDIKGLYQDPPKQQIIEEVAVAARDKFSADSPEASSSTSTDVEPTSYLWTLYFLAQHHSYLGRHAQALEILEEALTHTPTLPELHMFKGRVLKRAGDLCGGARCLEDARFLDGQDRFLNTKSAKYRLRAGMVEEASALLGLFTKVRSVPSAPFFSCLTRNLLAERRRDPRCGPRGHAVAVLPR